jgi:hypothetical protein
VGVTTVPTLRAQELRFAWERFVEDLEHSDAPDEDPALVRETIADSWRRSFAAGVEPTGTRFAPVISDEHDTEAAWEEHPLRRAAPLIRECLAATADEGAYLMVISDAKGVLLHIEGSPGVRMRAAESMNFSEGTLWSEPGAGTNAIGTAIACDHAVQVFGPEHFHEPVQRWVCSAAPVHDPDTGELLGIIDLTGDYSTVHPAILATATATARAVEAKLRLDLLERDERLRARFAQRMGSQSDRALFTPSGRALTPLPSGWRAEGRLFIPPGGGELDLPSGRPALAEPVGPALEAYIVRAIGAARARRRARATLKLSFLGHDRAVLHDGERRELLRPRLAEILALLCTHPHGLTAEALLADLHGDAGSVGGVRVEVSRLRKQLGPHIDTDPYRLTCDVETDVRRVEGLLAAGAVREAAEAYPGPMLPGSQAPGVVRERERLDAWMRQAVMRADDPEALWAWLQTPGGEDDLGAWKRFLAGIASSDPRRNLAAARVAELRRWLASSA